MYMCNSLDVFLYFSGKFNENSSQKESWKKWKPIWIQRIQRYVKKNFGEVFERHLYPYVFDSLCIMFMYLTLMVTKI